MNEETSGTESGRRYFDHFETTGVPGHVMEPIRDKNAENVKCRNQGPINLHPTALCSPPDVNQQTPSLYLRSRS